MKEFRFPTLIGIIIILFGLFGAMYLANSRTGLFLQADLSLQPKNLLISSLRPDQFTVSWKTEKETEGFVAYGETKNLGLNALDKRDVYAKKRGSYFNHYVTIYNLQPDNTYYFKVGSGSILFGGNFSLSQNCQDFINTFNNNPFGITMPNVEQLMARTEPVNGLFSSDISGKNPIPGVIVCLQIKNALPLTDLTSNSGSFVIPLFSLLSKDLTLITELNKEAEEEIIAFGPLGELTSARLKSRQDHPVPILSLGETYDFTKEVNSIKITPTFTPAITSSLSLTPTNASSSTSKLVSITPTLTATPTTTPPVELIFPLNKVSDQLPTFRGKGKPGLVFDIEVESPLTFKDTVKIDSNGFWSWTPPSNLAPGLHSITMTGRDEKGELIKLVKSFTIIAANPILAVSAGTPSATLAPIATLPPSPTPTNIPLPTNTPTLIPVPTIQLPASGISTPYIFFLTSGLLSIMLGIAMSFNSKKE